MPLVNRSFSSHYGAFVPVVLLALIAVGGAFCNSVDARGRVVDDTDNSPVPGSRCSTPAGSL